MLVLGSWNLAFVSSFWWCLFWAPQFFWMRLLENNVFMVNCTIFNIQKGLFILYLSWLLNYLFENGNNGNYACSCFSIRHSDICSILDFNFNVWNLMTIYCCFHPNSTWFAFKQVSLLKVLSLHAVSSYSLESLLWGNPVFNKFTWEKIFIYTTLSINPVNYIKLVNSGNRVSELSFQII